MAASACSPSPRRRSWLSALYPAVWRWHFWAGLAVTPFLIVVSLTGALFVFQEELQVWTQPEVMTVTVPADIPARSYTARFAAARAALPPQWEFSSFNQHAEPGRADEIVFEREVTSHDDDAESPVDDDHAHEHEHQFVYVDPYTGEVLGQQTLERSFFGIVLSLHRTLLAGSIGRYAVELATCWGIVSLLTGLLLWWPRGKEKLWGVWLPRLRRGGKLALRDLHTIPGLYLFGAALAIMGTGLLYTQVWGQGAFAGLYFGGQLPPSYVSPPTSSPLPPDTAPASIDDIVREARTHYAFPTFHLAAPHGTDGCWTLFGATDTGDLDDGVVYLDASTGATLDVIDYPSLAPGAKTALLFYSIHTGSIFGLTTKIIAVLACLVIIAMSVTGVWMWWRRRPAGKFGAPRKTRTEQVPKTIAATIVGLAVLFPLVGLSIVVLWLGETLLRVARRQRAATA
ncbi:PepSY-associated TM helix domain-containing protein [Synoicihabitans lomoniglobus]|uniref:PepSY domain-containing protein n=1 Tax=Synoicihabitans lomoniglobus TaxID=2909285 RepID=A0AAF0CP29_9BACT|nr:PepSY domain-containing protein [Opitutaceae bacterium LMO-M01]WED65496.1 PepSY domain-containing protein [Opitutaceae bacterium LMO-M01]